MKVYMMTDIEGVAGIINGADWVHPHSKYYEKGKEFLTKEVNAAIDGLFAAGATEVVVQDGHGSGAINIDLLDPRAKLQRGWDTSLGGAYPFGLNESFDVQVYVGQHPKAGTPYGHLCHTGNMNVIDKSVNGLSIGEFGEGVLLASVYGVKTIFASGCLAFTKEAQSLVEGIVTVAVKEGVTPGSGDECDEQTYRNRNTGAIHLQPQKARELIREGAYNALMKYKENPESFKSVKLDPPYSKLVVYRCAAGKIGYVVERNGYDNLAEVLNA